uniref:Uncharacterized protein n=1 Tax=Theileria annulata TaxID=5874 RepID=A0A3B0NDK2_THEAN
MCERYLIIILMIHLPLIPYTSCFSLNFINNKSSRNDNYVEDVVKLPSSIKYNIQNVNSIPTNEDNMFSRILQKRVEIDSDKKIQEINESIEDGSLIDPLTKDKLFQEEREENEKKLEKKEVSLDSSGENYKEGVESTSGEFGDISNKLQSDGVESTEADEIQLRDNLLNKLIKSQHKTVFGIYTLKKRVSLRRKIKSTRYSGEEYNCDGYESTNNLANSTHINVEDEIKTWDFFYTYDRASDYPFSGFNTTETVRIITQALSKLRPRRKTCLVSDSDVVLEVGHGKFPLIWDLRNYFGQFLYFGIEFSVIAFEQAVVHKFNNMCSPSEAYDKDVEFLSMNSLNYFNSDGTSNLNLIFPNDTESTRLKAGIVNIALGKSFLDYLSCRLTLSVSVSNWNLEPRIPQGVVEMFDSVSQALRDFKSDEKYPSLFVLVEPYDIVKFKDHIGIITKVIYTSTFVKQSESRYLRLVYVLRDKKTKAVCYALAKVDYTYHDYAELRNDMYKVTCNVYSFGPSTDEDWLLPQTVPPKWQSNDSKDFDNLTLL